MSRRFRARRVGDDDDRTARTAPVGRRRARRGAESDEHRRSGRAVRRRDRATRSSAAPTSAPASGTWSPEAPTAASDPREVIDHSIGPVWEANHVWLIFIFVVLWTCFPEAYASITLTLFVPLTIAAFGIVLRGASFAFRKAVFRTRDRRNFGAGVRRLVGARAVLHGRGRRWHRIGPGAAGGEAGDPWSSWINPTSILGGRARRRVACLPGRRVPGAGTPDGSADDDMVEYFRRRAVVAAVVAGVVAFGDLRACAPTRDTSSTGSPPGRCRS